MAANQSFLDNLTGLPKLWDQIKIYTKINGSKYPMRMENKAKTYTVG